MLKGKTPKGRFPSPIRYGDKTALNKEQRKLLTKAEKRMLEWSERKTVATAKSAAHLGVISRPTEQNVSKLLEIRRAQAQGRGTSVHRLKKWWKEEEENEKMTQDQKNTDSTETPVPEQHDLLRLKPKIIVQTPKKNQYHDLDA